MRRQTRRERGAELIEMALVLPLLLAVIAGIVDFAFLFQRFLVLNNAAREGARVAVLPGYLPAGTGGTVDTSAVTSRVQAYVREGIGDESITPSTQVEFVDAPGITPTVRMVRVTSSISYEYLILGPLAALIGGDFDSVDLTARATMRLEAEP
jgi:hypothetical protein